MNKTKFILKKFITLFTAFILAFALACLSLCITVKIASISSFTKGIINKTNYIDYAQEEIKEALSDLAIPSGLPADFFDSSITTDTVSKIVTDSVNYNFSGGEVPDFSSVKDDFKKEITLWANDNFV